MFRSATIFAAMCLGTSALAQDFLPRDSYARAFGGASRAVDGGIVDTGPLAGAALGLDRGSWRVEVEVARRSGTEDGRDRSIDTGAINGYRDFGDGRMTPYVGAGIGVSNANVSNRDGSASDSFLATGQAMIGVQYRFGGAASLNGEVRYMRTEEPSFSDTPLEALDAVVGVTLHF